MGTARAAEPRRQNRRSSYQTFPASDYERILFTLHAGCQSRWLVRDYPPWYTVYDYFWQTRKSGLWEQVNTLLRVQRHKKAHWQRTPSAAIIDSQSAKTTEKLGCTIMMVARK